ncbi:MAG: GGDEF domain-containing protein [Myxococcota bacterium]|nr:GGDEF domain-containing protein [Myxococcota bacterium]
MSFFGGRRGGGAKDVTRGDLGAELKRGAEPPRRSRAHIATAQDLDAVDRGRGDALAAELRKTTQAKRPARLRAARAMSDALAQSLRLLRRALPGDTEEARRVLAEIEADVGRAMVPEDYAELAERLRSVSLPPVAQPGGGFALELFHRVVFAAQPVAHAFALRAAIADLSELLKVPSLDGPDDKPVRTLSLLFESFSLHAARTKEGAEIMKRCVGELIDTLGRLADGEEAQGARLSEIRERLIEAEDIQDLDVLRGLLLQHAGSLVEAASARRGAVRDAVEAAHLSRRRAEELEAALSDAEEEARTDALTGLGNRRAMLEAVERLAGHDRDVGVLAIDLDHFKALNDAHGHAGGDAVLRHVADLLRGELRGDDEAFRVGGEELVVLLPEGSWQGARATGERLRARLSRAPVPVAPEVEAAVTMSIGVALWTCTLPFEDTLELADAALYRAKEGGRNRVVG